MKIKNILLCLSIAVACTTILHAQEKRQLTREDYKLWHKLSTGQLSPDGVWTNYALHHTEADTAYVKNTVTGLKYSFPSGTEAHLSPDGKWFACIQKDSLVLLELATGKQQALAGISQYDFTKAGFIVAAGNSNPNRTLYVWSLKNGKRTAFNQVSNYIFSPDAKNIAIISDVNAKSVVSLIEPGKTEVMFLMSGQTASFKKMQWSNNGKALLLYQVTNTDLENQYKLHHIKFNNKNNLHPKISTLEKPTLPANKEILDYSIYLSDDGNKVFFDLPIAKPSKEIDKNAPLVWKSLAPIIPPPKPQFYNNSRCWGWWPKSNRLSQLETDEFQRMALTGDQNNALLFNEDQHVPKFKYGGDLIDYYILDLETGIINPLVMDQLDQVNHIVISPAGKYVAYFKDKQWWIYDITTHIQRCLTVKLKVPFIKANYDFSGRPIPYACGGFTTNDKEIILYDEFDIWLVSTDGRSSRKITSGRASNTVFRINTNGLMPQSVGKVAGYVASKLNLKKGFVLNTLNTSTLEEGYSIWKQDEPLIELIKCNKQLSGLLKADNSDTFQYLESSFESPPALMVLKMGNDPKCIVRENPQQNQFLWGHSELLHYEVDGKLTRGTLLYPAGYVAGKQYPMIVSIYEKTSYRLHEYSPPTEYEVADINSTSYTTGGYFVLYPDIRYTLNEPGPSALKYVTAAVNKVLETGMIDPSKLGLHGHSFGGYETTYIIGHSNIFKTAIAGAPVTDLLSIYLLPDGYGLSNIWHFENQQMRLEVPFYGSLFNANSPLASVANINTPLLLWAGVNDKEVDYLQSVKFFTALWRLQKDCTLVVYPGEQHVLYKPANQLDISTKMREWFDYYLQDKPKPAWK